MKVETLLKCLENVDLEATVFICTSGGAKIAYTVEVIHSDKKCFDGDGINLDTSDVKVYIGGLS